MPNTLPDFIVNKIYVKNSLKTDGSGFVFILNNSFAPVLIQGFSILSDGIPLEQPRISISYQGQDCKTANSITPLAPLPFSINIPYIVQVENSPLPVKSLSLLVNTRDAGEVVMNIRLKSIKVKPQGKLRWQLPAWLLPSLRAKAEVSAVDVIGEINPFVYGQFIEHLERCIYGGLWTDDGSKVREDVVRLLEPLKMPLLRYPGGNFASGYHWEDGIGEKSSRPQRFDAAWSASESNQVGTDEALALMERLGVEPFLVVNDGSGTAEEAARWVEYCNARSGQQAERRSANGHAAPYNVKIWGIGNEVWGRWQIGSVSADEYAERLIRFSHAMRAVDPSIRIVAVGNTIASNRVDDPGRLWNEVILRKCATEIDELSFHIYQPDQDGWKENIEADSLHRSVCAAPLEVERMIMRMAELIMKVSPEKKIGVVLDEWNLWLTPPKQAASMHQVIYTQRDALYCAGMLNVFQRQCRSITMANLAQLVNVLPLIVTDSERAYPTPMYWSFWMYTFMQSMALNTKVSVTCFDSDAMGNTIPAEKNVPYLDFTATTSPDRNCLSLGLINRHPRRKMNIEIGLKGFQGLKPIKAYILTSPGSLAANTFDAPDQVRAKSCSLPEYNGEKLLIHLPASSVMVLVLEK